MSLIQRLKRALPRATFWRQMALVAGGTAIGQLASVLASPILSRLYAPSDFGILAVYTSVTGLLAVVCTFSFQLGVPVAETDEDASRLLLLSIASALAVAAALAVGVILLHDHVDDFVSVRGFEPFVFLVPLGVLGLGTYEALSQWASRQKAFALIGKTSAGRSLIQVGTQLGAGMARLGAGGLVVGQLLGQWSGGLQIARLFWRKDAQLVRSTRLADLRETAGKYRRYPTASLPGAVLAALDANSAPLLFAHFFGAATTGQFALGQRLLAIPFFLVGSAAQKVFAPAAASARRDGRLAFETEQTFRRLLWLVFPMVFLLAISAPELFTVVLGKNWAEAGSFMQWMSLRTCFTLIVFPLIPLVNLLERQVMGTLFSGAQFAVRVAAIYLGSRLEDAHSAVALLGTCTGAMWVGYLVYLLSLGGVPLGKALGIFVKEALRPAALAAPVLLLKLLGGSPLLVTVAALVAGGLALALVARRMRKETSAALAEGTVAP